MPGVDVSADPSIDFLTVIREALTKEIAVMIKSSPADLVTVTDQKVENMLISSIKEKYPSHRTAGYVKDKLAKHVEEQLVHKHHSPVVSDVLSFIGEESVAAGAGSTLTDNPTWIIDPIDGTTNFVHRFPFVAVSIGFVVKKQMEFGIVYSCIEDKMYTARKGKGAFCNGQKLQVSQQHDITKALLVSELGSNRDPEVIKTVLSNMQRLLSIPVHGVTQRRKSKAEVKRDVCTNMLPIHGGPFDLMSRRIIAANSQVLAERIAKEIQVIPFQRDDATN
ncbi:hypothetical protein JD844_016037 [Phrynosoma platyrhinos]|uniref:Inositol-1-monophosphatase n=1 Tax=Phrynosoma platyrhinos TaxID=52577 RepID=A0ABQ7SJT6_PHRPL|nr:hypothetical protein JD844_016037 [Phrynosoma platyrhinos]